MEKCFAIDGDAVEKSLGAIGEWPLVFGCRGEVCATECGGGNHEWMIFYGLREVENGEGDKMRGFRLPLRSRVFCSSIVSQAGDGSLLWPAQEMVLYCGAAVCTRGEGDVVEWKAV